MHLQHKRCAQHTCYCIQSHIKWFEKWPLKEWEVVAAANAQLHFIFHEKWMSAASSLTQQAGRNKISIYKICEDGIQYTIRNFIYYILPILMQKWKLSNVYNVTYKCIYEYTHSLSLSLSSLLRLVLPITKKNPSLLRIITVIVCYAVMRKIHLILNCHYSHEITMIRKLGFHLNAFIE